MGKTFQPTRWSLIQQVSATDTGQRERAWEEFDVRYREPLLAFVLRSGWGAEEAEDLLQSFLSKLAERDWLEEADRERGKMRTFLLGRLKGHLGDARKHRAAKKRGGDVEIVPLESAPGGEFAAQGEEEANFDREWGHAILGRTLATLKAEAIAAGKGDVFDVLHSQITGGTAGQIGDAAAKLGQTHGATRMQLQRLRERFRQELRAEVAETLLPGEDVSEELRYLASVLG